MNPNLQNLATPLDHSAQTFVLWSLATLGVSFRRCDNSYLMSVPESHQRALGGETVRFSFELDETAREADDTERLTVDSRLFRWLIDQLQRSQEVIHSVAKRQPASVHEVAERVFSAYAVEDGSVHLSGCTIEDRPFLRLTHIHKANGAIESDQLKHAYFHADGSQVDEEIARELGLQELVPSATGRRITRAQLKNWLTEAEQRGEDGEQSAGEWIVSTVVWCKYATGKITFTIGEVSAEHSFEGWCKLFEEGKQKPPPYQCAVTGRSSYDLAVTDDGRLTVIQAIEQCAETGQRLLACDLETCSVTGRRVARDVLATCPVTQLQATLAVMPNCSMCDQRVSPEAINSDQCSACRSLQPVSKDDPRMARILGEYPNLDTWARWSLTETASAYILMASATIKRLLVVVEKDRMKLLRIASGSRFSKRWPAAPLAEQEHYSKTDS